MNSVARNLRYVMVVLIALLSSLALAAVDSPEGIAFFETKIRPVLIEKCYECHSATAKKLKGGLLLDTRDGAREGGNTGPAVVPGDEKHSLLLTAIRYHDADLEMPPKERLPERVVEDFAKWIAIGAPDPRASGGPVARAEGIDIEEGKKHWAYTPIGNPEIPRTKNSDWPRSDIDRFILAGLEAKGLQPVGDAPPEQLLRRVYFDLTGLPPTPDEVRQFAAEVKSAGGATRAALITLVDRLLASPRFGERWARHWLDVARFGESTGGAHNVLIPVAYRYRNWVIDSFNHDKPYDQFVREQLAGDLLPAATDQQRDEQTIGTGFLTVGTKDLREVNLNRYRMEIAAEQIDATGRAMLASTFACARCHDHKFDPIPTRDYYALAGIFASSEPLLGAKRVRNPEPFAANLQPLAAAPVKLTDAEFKEFHKVRFEYQKARAALGKESLKLLSGSGKPELKVKNGKIRTEIQKQYLSAFPQIREMEAEVAKLEVVYEKYVKRYDAMVPFSATAVRDFNPKNVAIHIRGEDTHLGEIVPRGFPAVLTSPATKPVNPTQSGRLELAGWIASPENPLTARVMVNRIWQHLFGVGIVDTPDDFGKTGSAPSNLQLLDHLAQRFISQGWSMKKLIREIMLTRAYQLGTDHDAAAYEVDVANRLVWRMNRRRLDSDAILDSLRYISGALTLSRPTVPTPPTEYDDRLKSFDHDKWYASTRGGRTIYQPVLREYVPDDWSVFDFPDPELVTGMRNNTTVPTQALYLMNSPAVVEYSRLVAERIVAGAADGDAARIERAFQTILARSATAEERAEAEQFFASFVQADVKVGDPIAKWAALCQALIGSGEFRYIY